MEKTLKNYYPVLCVTHACNLSCRYCYQKHKDASRMSLETGKRLIDSILSQLPEGIEKMEMSFIGGEPLLEFELIKQLVNYTESRNPPCKYIFFASTNGTLLTPEMKEWLVKNKHRFVLGLSLDGTKDTHDYNRSNSFDTIDIDFFLKTWPFQGVKMTLSEYSIQHLAENIKYLHSIGINQIHGVNFFEGDFDWDDDKFIRVLVPQLKELVDFYVANPDLPVNQLLDKHLHLCESQNKNRRKWCGIGDGTVFFDVDGTQYPCSFVTPMTFSQKEIQDIVDTDFKNDENFLDEDCINNCYVYPLCPSCSGANYMINKSFKLRNKSKCRVLKLILLFVADMQARKIANKTDKLDARTKYWTIETIKKIKSMYFEEFKPFLE